MSSGRMLVGKPWAGFLMRFALGAKILDKDNVFYAHAELHDERLVVCK